MGKIETEIEDISKKKRRNFKQEVISKSGLNSKRIFEAGATSLNRKIRWRLGQTMTKDRKAIKLALDGDHKE